MKVILNYAVSADGKISTADRTGSGFSSREDKKRMDKIRALADIIVVGAETVRRDDPPFHLRTREAVILREQSSSPPHPDLCILTRSGKLPHTLRVFNQKYFRVYLATSAKVAPGENVSANCSVLEIGPGDPLPGLLDRLSELGYQTVLVEGGGRINSLFFEAGLVNEIYMTLCPVVLGGASAPTPVDGRGLPPSRIPRLKLHSLEQVDDELFVHYIIG